MRPIIHGMCLRCRNKKRTIPVIGWLKKQPFFYKEKFHRLLFYPSHTLPYTHITNDIICIITTLINGLQFVWLVLLYPVYNYIYMSSFSIPHFGYSINCPLFKYNSVVVCAICVCYLYLPWVFTAASLNLSPLNSSVSYKYV